MKSHREQMIDELMASKITSFNEWGEEVSVTFEKP